MRVVLQRVSSASVTIDGAVAGKIGQGLLLLVGIEAADTVEDGGWLAQKIVKLRLFADETGQMNRSVAEVSGGILIVSQFTLHASTRKGTRPSYHQAAPSAHAQPLYTEFIRQVSAALLRPVASGEFGADMRVALVNDGPVTLIIDSKQRE